VRRHQRQAAAAAGKTKRKLLSDHPTHRNAYDVSPIPGELIQKPHGITRHPRDGAQKRASITVADTKVIEVAAAVVPLQVVDLRTPDRARHPEAHDEEHGGALLAEQLIRETRRRSGQLHARRAC